MKKFKHVLLVFVLIAVLNRTQDVRADAAPPEDPSTAGISPGFAYLPTKVRMESERVSMVLYESTAVIPLYALYGENYHIFIDVTAEFHMLNLGEEMESMDVMFPLTTDLGCYQWPSYEIVEDSFRVQVDGQELEYEEIFTDNPRDMSDCDLVKWASFHVDFPVQQPVTIQVGYISMDQNIQRMSVGRLGAQYILETGAAWYGSIGAIEIIFTAPNPLTEENAWAQPTNFIYDDRSLVWRWTDLEPTARDNISVSVIGERTWDEILSLRAITDSEPGNAQAWYDLGRIYGNLTFRGPSPRVDNLRYANLAETAYRNAVTLEPQNAEYVRALTESFVYRCLGDRSAPLITMELPYCQAAAYELSILKALDPDNDGIEGLEGWVRYVERTTSDQLTPTVTQTDTPSPLPTIAPSPEATSWRMLGNDLLPSNTQAPTEAGMTPWIMLGVGLGVLAILVGSVLMIRKRISVRGKMVRSEEQQSKDPTSS